MIYYVAKNGNDYFQGTEAEPFLTINKAASIAMPGDTVIVSEGEYREWVDPKNGGVSDLNRITYKAKEGDHVVIKGSEQISGWEHYKENVWFVKLDNAMFGDFNPYATYLYGDWMVSPEKPTIHLGDVYMNGISFFEALSLEDVIKAEARTTGCCLPWGSGYQEVIPYPERTAYQWYSEVTEKYTTIWANFQGHCPNEEIVEINVRKCVFYPKTQGKGYITVKGFELAHAATPYAPPTGDQPGLIGPHWSKGWIIEDNYIHDAKCSAVSLGKDEVTGDNLFTKTRRKPGYSYQFEAVGKALQLGWNKDNIGSHIVRNNIIHSCGQNGIVGHLGCIFSEIYGNEIYDIAQKHEWFGYEIAGIKFHAAIDTQVHHNNIHDCTCGMWSDWETQGTRISSNIFYRNNRDLMIEVSHGPYIVDNNILASAYSLENASQGGAYVHNLILGRSIHWNILDRSTPYHFPHSTALLASSFIYGGDDRIYNNIFVGGQATDHEEEGVSTGTAKYNGHPDSYEEFVQLIEEALPGDEILYVKVKQPVYINQNAYFNGAESYEKELNPIKGQNNVEYRIVEEFVNDKKEVYLELSGMEEVISTNCDKVDTAMLGISRTADQMYENPDGSAICFDCDMSGNIRTGVIPGPFATLNSGKNRIKIW